MGQTAAQIRREARLRDRDRVSAGQGGTLIDAPF
jgi:hypothetical protein